MNENKHTHENADLLKRLRHIARLDAENYGALPEDAAVWKAADLIETITKQRDELLATVEYLWNIIDDIDTYGDVAKSNDRLFRKLVERRQSDRWKTGITTDGYTLNYDAITSVKETK